MKQDIHHSLAYVQLVDYGNDEQVPETALYTLPYESGMDVLQEQSMMCALAGVKPITPRHTTEYLRNILMNRLLALSSLSLSLSYLTFLCFILFESSGELRQHQYKLLKAVESNFTNMLHTNSSLNVTFCKTAYCS